MGLIGVNARVAKCNDHFDSLLKAFICRRLWRGDTDVVDLAQRPDRDKTFLSRKASPQAM
jgi:hypothetical protein